jgi:hypothetical protein
MQIWQDLIKYSLIGSERQTAPLSADGDLQVYINQLYPNNTVPTGEAREQALLSAAALVTQYRLAGQQAATFSGTLPAIDEAEPLPLLSPLCISHLQRFLNDSELKVILPEWLAQAVTVKRRVPFALIPPLLELAAQNRSVRPAITALIDKRGQWLAAQHSDWHKLLVQTEAILDDVSIWEEGSPAQREEYLRQYRQQDATKARELLQAVWKQEPAATRQSLLSVFSVNLSSNDEAFLTTCLEDRSKGVRQLAATLLGQLPDSAFSQRQKQRLNTWLRFEKGGLLRKNKLIVELPESYDKTWLIDGIEEKPPQGKGEKAWWLEQALSFVPPAYWSAQWQLSPDDSLALLAKHEWRKTIQDAWKQALQNYPDAAWAETFLTRFDINQIELWRVIPPAQAERLATQLLSTAEEKQLATVLSILIHIQHAWSVEFSEQVINAIHRYTQQKLTPSEMYACYYLADFARYLAPDCCDLLAKNIPSEHQYDQITRALNKIQYTLSFRRDMSNALANQ